jgi:type I restriction enzyme S subunit
MQKLSSISKQVTLNSIVETRSGGTPSRTNPDYWGDYLPWVTAKDLKTFYLEDSLEKISFKAVKKGVPLAKNNEVLILVRGMGLMKDVPIGVAKCQMSFGQDIKVLVPKEGIDGEYLAHFLVAARPQLMDMVTLSGHGTGRIETEKLLSLKVWLPTLQVQKRIIDCLTIWNNAIAITEKLITAKRRLKQGLRQKVFFSDKSKSWKMYKLGDLFERITRKNDIGCEIVLTSSGEQGLINQKDFFNRRVASADLSGYYLMRKGEFAYNRSSMKGYPYGAIKRLDRYETAALSTLYVCFRLIQKDFSSNFFLYLFEAGVLNGEIYKIVNEGARSHGLLNLSIPTFFDIKIRVPEINVQNKIAMIFETVDCEINVLAQYLEKLKTQKQGLMQQLLTGKIRIQTP